MHDQQQPYWQKEVAEIWKLFRETDKRFNEQFKKTDKKIKKLAELFTGQWGKLIESLVEGKLVELYSTNLNLQ